MGQKKSLPEWRYKQEDPLIARARVRFSHVDVATKAEAEAASLRWCIRLRSCDRVVAWKDENYAWDFDVERTAAEWIALEAFTYFDQHIDAMRAATVDANGRDSRNRVYASAELIELKDAEYHARWEKAAGGNTKQDMS